MNTVKIIYYSEHLVIRWWAHTPPQWSFEFDRHGMTLDIGRLSIDVEF